MGRADEVLRNSYNETGSINVSIQDQTTPSIEHYMYEELEDVIITTAYSRGDNIITLESGHGFVGVVGLEKEHLNIYYNVEGVDGLFGDITALTNGMYLGFENESFAEYNLVVLDNAELRNSAFEVEYTNRSGGQGNYGVSFWKKSSGFENLGVTIRLDGSMNDTLCTYVQDDLTGIIRFRIKILGHIVD